MELTRSEIRYLLDVVVEAREANDALLVWDARSYEAKHYSGYNMLVELEKKLKAADNGDTLVFMGDGSCK